MPAVGVEEYLQRLEAWLLYRLCKPRTVLGQGSINTPDIIHLGPQILIRAKAMNIDLKIEIKVDVAQVICAFTGLVTVGAKCLGYL